MFTEVLTQGMRGNSMNIEDGKGSSGKGVGRRRGCSRIFPEGYYPVKRLMPASLFRSAARLRRYHAGILRRQNSRRPSTRFLWPLIQPAISVLLQKWMPFWSLRPMPVI